MRFIRNTITRLIKHWQSSLVAVMIGVLTYELHNKDITVTEWGVAIGTVLTVWGAISKDPDKTQNKP